MSAPEYRNIGKSASDLLTKNFVGKKSNSLLVKFANTKKTYNAEITFQKKEDQIEGTVKETLKITNEKFEKIKPEFTCELKSSKQFTGTAAITPDFDLDVDLSAKAKFICCGKEDNGLTLEGTVSHEKFRFNGGILAYPTVASTIPGSDEKKKLVNYNAELTLAAVDNLSIGGQVSGKNAELPSKYAGAFTYDISDNIQIGGFVSNEQSKFEDEENESKLSNKNTFSCGINVFHKVNSNVSIAGQFEHKSEKVTVVGAKKDNGESSTNNKDCSPYLFTLGGQFNTPELDGTLKLKVNTKKVGSCAYNTKLSDSLSLTVASEVENVLAIDDLKHKYAVDLTFDF